jgi:hypothetical protein
VPAGDVENREHQPIPETRSRLALLIVLYEQPPFQQARVVEAEGVHVRPHQADLARREADSEFFRHVA